MNLKYYCGKLPLKYYIDQLSEYIVCENISGACDMCVNCSCASQQSGFVCRSGVKDFLINKMTEFAEMFKDNMKVNKQYYDYFNLLHQNSNDDDVVVLLHKLINKYSNLTEHQAKAIVMTWFDIKEEVIFSPEWTPEEKLCYIAHIWADKEPCCEILEDYGFSDMAKAAVKFIECQQPNIEFTEHIENCFFLLQKIEYDVENWTKENFMDLYSKYDQPNDIPSKELLWQKYISYIEKVHDSPEYAGCSLVGYDEWLANEYKDQTITQQQNTSYLTEEV